MGRGKHKRSKQNADTGARSITAVAAVATTSKEEVLRQPSGDAILRAVATLEVLLEVVSPEELLCRCGRVGLRRALDGLLPHSSLGETSGAARKAATLLVDSAPIETAATGLAATALTEEEEELEPDVLELEALLLSLATTPGAFGGKATRPLRKALHPLLATRARQMHGGTLSGRISSAFAGGRWHDACALLRQMQPPSLAPPPKLGAVQRWVRDCTQCGLLPEAQSLYLLDCILRTVYPPHTTAVSPLAPPLAAAPATGDKRRLEGEGAGEEEGSPPGHDGGGQWVEPSLCGSVNTHAPWAPSPLSTDQGESGAAGDSHTRPVEGIHIVAYEKAADRHPPNRYDLTVYTTTPACCPISTAAPGTDKVVRTDVPGVAGAFVMEHVLSWSECRQLIAVAEAMGYAPDEPLGTPQDTRAMGCVWLADEAVGDALFQRCRAHLPASLAGGDLVGINARWRLYRYDPGNVYRRHVDGAWPGSGLVDGRLQYDAYGDRWSRLTFVLYLNEGFGGGATTFYYPGDTPGRLEEQAVEPRTGMVLCFPHGETADSGLPFAPVHEGALVHSGRKYILRTDVLYRLSTGRAEGQRANMHRRHLGVNAALFKKPLGVASMPGETEAGTR